MWSGFRSSHREGRRSMDPPCTSVGLFLLIFRPSIRRRNPFHRFSFVFSTITRSSSSFPSLPPRPHPQRTLQDFLEHLLDPIRSSSFASECRLHSRQRTLSPLPNRNRLHKRIRHCLGTTVWDRNASCESFRGDGFVERRDGKSRSDRSSLGREERESCTRIFEGQLEITAERGRETEYLLGTDRKSGNEKES